MQKSFVSVCNVNCIPMKVMYFVKIHGINDNFMNQKSHFIEKSTYINELKSKKEKV